MGLIFNEDPNHFVYTRAQAGVTELSEKELTDFIDGYAGTNITDFLICVNASLPHFRTKTIESVCDKYRAWEKAGRLAGRENDPIIKSTRLLCETLDKGLDIHSIWIDCLRKNGIKPWISVRMNDIHNAGDEDAFLPSGFSRSHPEYLRAGYRTPSGYYEYALDYTFPEVREYYLSVISEALETFDADGIELDFMREIYCFGVGREYAGIEIMTDFIEKAVALVRRFEEAREHRINVGIRLPDSPEKALRLGFDAVEWINRGYFDLITVSPRWSSADSDMPIDFWKRLLRGKNIRLAAGLDVLLDAYNRRGRKYLFGTAESSLGMACAYTAMGADDIYLFNFMDIIDQVDAESKPLFEKNNYRKFLCTIGDAEKQSASPRRYIVTYSDTSAVGLPSRRPLPITVGSGFSALRIPTGTVPGEKIARLIIGTECKSEFTGDKITVYANAKRCAFAGEVPPPELAYGDMRYFAYEIDLPQALPIVTEAEFSSPDENIKIHWAEIQIK